MSDVKFADGMIVKIPDNKPEYVVCKLSVKVDEFIQTLQDNAAEGWVNIEVLIAKSGKPYAKIDTWRPTQGQSAKAGMAQARKAAEPDDSFEDSIPF